MTKTAKTAATASVQWKVFECTNCGRRSGSCRPDILPDVNSSASLPAIRALWSGAKNEAGAADIMDHGSFARPVHLVAEPAHMDVHQVRRRNELIVPDLLQKHRSRQQLIAALHHIFEQAKLARQQIDHAVAAFGGTFDQVEFKRPGAQRGLARFR